MVKIEEIENELALVVQKKSDWPAILMFLHVHFISFIVLLFIKDVYISTILFGLLLVGLGVLGTTAGAHRLWTHRTYTADWKLRIFLMLCQTLVGEGTIYNWVLEHRLHHKYCGTSLDPFNIKKGLFNVHVLSKTIKISNGLDRLRTELDMSDIENDSVVMFQKNYYWLLYLIVTWLLPINAPAEYWGESLVLSLLVIGALRTTISLNLSWLISSYPKIWSLKSEQNNLTGHNLLELIEKQDWLPYHYLAPWDYRSSEYGGYGNDLASVFIRLCKTLGLTSNLKTMDGLTIGKAIHISVETGRSISECLLEVQSFEQ